jgi:hypothetical protein
MSTPNQPSDPAARLGISADVAAEQAVAKARALLANGPLASVEVQHAVAAALGRSDRLQDVTQAHDLALLAMASHRPSRRLAAELFDRLRVLQGQPQKFGTQPPMADGFEVDSWTTDSERAKWDLPPLAELKAKAGVGRS